MLVAIKASELAENQQFTFHGKWYRRCDVATQAKHPAAPEIKEMCWVGAYSVPDKRRENDAPVPVSFTGATTVFVEEAE